MTSVYSHTSRITHHIRIKAELRLIAAKQVTARAARRVALEAARNQSLVEFAQKIRAKAQPPSDMLFNGLSAHSIDVFRDDHRFGIRHLRPNTGERRFDVRRAHPPFS